MKPLKPLTLRFLLVFILVGTQILALGGILCALDREADQITRGHTQEVIQHVAETVTDKTRRFILPAEQAVSLTRFLILRAVLSAGNDNELERYFLSQLNTAPQLAGMFLGRNDGSFVFVTRVQNGFLTKFIRVKDQSRIVERVTRDANALQTGRAIDPDDPYDPRSRPWFQRAVEANQPGTLIWTDPYVFFTSKQPGITAAASVLAAENSSAGAQTLAIGVDVEIDTLSQFVERIPIGRNGSALILDNNGVVAAARGLRAMLDKTANPKLPKALEVADRATVALLQSVAALPDPGRGLLAFTIDSKVHHGLVTPLDWGRLLGWKLAIQAPEEDFGAITRDQRRQAIWIFLATGLLSCLLVGPLLFRATRPIVRLHQRATTDQMTGLYNRSEFLNRLHEAGRRPIDAGQCLAVAIFDLDGFKSVNDTYGHGNTAAKLAVTIALGGRYNVVLLPLTFPLRRAVSR